MGDGRWRMLRALNLRLHLWGHPGPCWMRPLLRLHLGTVEVDANKTLKKHARVCVSLHGHMPLN